MWWLFFAFVLLSNATATPQLPPSAIDTTQAAFGGTYSDCDGSPCVTPSSVPLWPSSHGGTSSRWPSLSLNTRPRAPVVVACLGGSATAGGGHMPRDKQYASLLRAALQRTGSEGGAPHVDLLGAALSGRRQRQETGGEGGAPHVDGGAATRKQGPVVLNMAHGMTDTFYALLHFNALVPRNATHVVWEYAINDPDNDCEPQKAPSWGCTDQTRGRGFCPRGKCGDGCVERNCGSGGCACQLAFRAMTAEYVRYFRRFVEMVRDHPNRPVLIFVMLWNAPFTLPHPKTVIHDRLRPLLANQLVVDVARDWVEQKCHALARGRQCSSTSITDKAMFIAEESGGGAGVVKRYDSHPNEAIHRYIGGRLFDIIDGNGGAAFRPLVDETLKKNTPLLRAKETTPTQPNKPMRATGDNGAIDVERAASWRTTSLLFDAPRLPSQDDLVARFNLTYATKGKAESNRFDRMRSVIVPACGKGKEGTQPQQGLPGLRELSFNVIIQPDEQLKGVTVDIGREAAKTLSIEWRADGHPDGQEKLGVVYTDAEGTTTGGSAKRVPLRLASWALPVLPSYHGFYDAWFEVDCEGEFATQLIETNYCAARRRLVRGAGTLFVCDNTRTSVRWISALVVKKGVGEEDA